MASHEARIKRLEAAWMERQRYGRSYEAAARTMRQIYGDGSGEVTPQDVESVRRMMTDEEYRKAFLERVYGQPD